VPPKELTMKLTPTQKRNMLEQLAEDQFADRFKELEEQLKALARKAAVKFRPKKFEKLLGFARANGISNMHINATQTLNCYSGWFEDFNGHNRMYLTFSDSNLKFDFVMERHFNPRLEGDEWVPENGRHDFNINSDEVLKGCEPELFGIRTAWNALYVELSTLMKDAEKVLWSINTDKQLREITKVFDPFMPSNGMALMTQTDKKAVASLNKLKTPKRKEKADA